MLGVYGVGSFKVREGGAERGWRGERGWGDRGGGVEEGNCDARDAGATLLVADPKKLIISDQKKLLCVFL